MQIFLIVDISSWFNLDIAFFFNKTSIWLETLANTSLIFVYTFLSLSLPFPLCYLFFLKISILYFSNWNFSFFVFFCLTLNFCTKLLMMFWYSFWDQWSFHLHLFWFEGKFIRNLEIVSLCSFILSCLLFSLRISLGINAGIMMKLQKYAKCLLVFWTRYVFK